MRLFVLRSEPAFLHYFDPTKVSKQPYPLTGGWCVTCGLQPGESGLRLIHLLLVDTRQDDVNPAGGFSLRGCLVSSLEDNGVPSGESGPSTP